MTVLSHGRLPETDNPVYDSYIRKFNASSTLSPESLFQYFSAFARSHEPRTQNILKFAFKKSPNLLSLCSRKRDMQKLYQSVSEMRIQIPQPQVFPERLLSRSELDRLKRSATPRIALVMESLFLSGIRISELC